jgi:hypothetical protein
MALVRVTLEKLDAEVLLPMILEQRRDRARSAAGGYWLVLHTAITAALGSQSPARESQEEPPVTVDDSPSS